MESFFLGARFLSTKTEAGFRVRAARATRVEIWIYSAPTGAAPILSQAMTPEAGGAFIFDVSIAKLKALGIQDTIYYGYRAWGPNWIFDASWTPGSAAGFATDVDDQGNRFNPNKLLLDPYTLEISH